MNESLHSTSIVSYHLSIACANDNHQDDSVIKAKPDEDDVRVAPGNDVGVAIGTHQVGASMAGQPRAAESTGDEGFRWPAASCPCPCNIA
jgi:hypothetical protein